MQVQLVTAAQADRLVGEGCIVKSVSGRSAFSMSKAGLRLKWSKKSYNATLRKMRAAGRTEDQINYFKIKEGQRKRAAEKAMCAEYRTWLRAYGGRAKDKTAAFVKWMKDNKGTYTGDPWAAYIKTKPVVQDSEQWTAACDIINKARHVEDGILHEERVYLVYTIFEHGCIVRDYIHAVASRIPVLGDFEPSDDKPDEPVSLYGTSDGKPAARAPKFVGFRGKNYTGLVLNFLLDTWKEPLVDTIPVPVYKYSVGGKMDRAKDIPCEFAGRGTAEQEPYSCKFHSIGKLRRFKKQTEQALGEWLDARGMMDYEPSIEFDPDAEPTLPRGALGRICAVAGGGTRVTFGSAPRRAVADEASPDEVIWGDA